MWTDFLHHINYWLSAALFLIGLYGMLAKPNLVRKLMAMNIVHVAVILFFISVAFKDEATPPIAKQGDVAPIAADYVNPLPHTLMLTAIVVGVSTTGVALALLIRIHRRFGTLNETELLEKLKE
ncbi:MAG: cation:proton antiporter subunit C [Acidobacteriota bacterium]